VLEAASIDGATGLQKMKSIILPLMVPSFVICLFLTLSRAFMVYDVNLTLTGGEPYGSTRLVAMHVYEKAFTSRNYGVGQAEALILFIIVACISGAQIYIGKKKEVEA
jgi:raffinose/stachyose/melibiose transport system permease protein